MADERFMLARSDEHLKYYEERARREWAAAKASTKPEVASAHRLLAMQYDADARELREQLAVNA